jgi:hypothetical protein
MLCCAKRLAICPESNHVDLFGNADVERYYENDEENEIQRPTQDFAYDGAVVGRYGITFSFPRCLRGSVVHKVERQHIPAPIAYKICNGEVAFTEWLEYKTSKIAAHLAMPA